MRELSSLCVFREQSVLLVSIGLGGIGSAEPDERALVWRRRLHRWWTLTTAETRPKHLQLAPHVDDDARSSLRGRCGCSAERAVSESVLDSCSCAPPNRRAARARIEILILASGQTTPARNLDVSVTAGATHDDRPGDRSLGHRPLGPYLWPHRPIARYARPTATVAVGDGPSR